jgi:hypothetical protein
MMIRFQFQPILLRMGTRSPQFCDSRLSQGKLRTTRALRSELLLFRRHHGQISSLIFWSTIEIVTLFVASSSIGVNVQSVNYALFTRDILMRIIPELFSTFTSFPVATIGTHLFNFDWRDRMPSPENREAISNL